MDIYWLGRVPYRPTWELQERCRQQVLAGGPEVLLLCEHDPVLTLGRSAGTSDLLTTPAGLAAAGVDLVVSDRGGQITYHGPGQLVAYPIRTVNRGVRAHVQALADAAVAIASALAVPAQRSEDPVGVFVGPRKLAAIGVSVHQRVSCHGMAINVTAAASAAFRRGLFHPCGQVAAQVTSLAEEAPDASRCQVEAQVEPLARALCQALHLPYPAGGVRAGPPALP